jgi:DNA polymerase-3 subunit epsilon
VSDNHFPHIRPGPYIMTHDTVIVGDTETTGLSPYGVNQDTGELKNDPDGPDRLCSASFLKMRKILGRWKQEASFSFKVDPNRPIPQLASKVNGFGWSGREEISPTLEDLYGLNDFSVIAPALVRFLADTPLVFHNVVFDIAVLDAELVRAGYTAISQEIICTKKAFSDLQGKGRPSEYVPGTNLNNLCTLLNVDKSARIGANGQELHGAEVDAQLCLGSFIELSKAGWLKAEYPEDLPHRFLNWQIYLDSNLEVKR